jgi:molybdopterin molybdotransferase
MQENVSLQDDQITLLVDNTRCGQNIRPAGQDIQQGGKILKQGQRIRPQDIGLLSSIGVAQVPVMRRLKVALISTGDELVEPGQPLDEGQIYNSNRYMLAALLQAMGCEVVDGGIVEDDFDTTKNQLSKLAENADVVISSGGVSVGDEDHVKNAVEALGEISLWKLNIKPGKPVAFGSVKGTPFCGLPGNPSSAFVTFCLLARSFILKRQGCVQWQPLSLQVPADFETKKAGTRQSYQRARVEMAENGSDKVVSLYSNQSSGILTSVSWANALVIIPPGKVVAKGDLLEVILLSELIG